MNEDNPKPDPSSQPRFPMPRLPQRPPDTPKFEPSDTSHLRTKKKTVRISLPPQTSPEPGIQHAAGPSKPARPWWKFWGRSG